MPSPFIPASFKEQKAKQMRQGLSLFTSKMNQMFSLLKQEPNELSLVGSADMGTRQLPVVSSVFKMG